MVCNQTNISWKNATSGSAELALVIRTKAGAIQRSWAREVRLIQLRLQAWIDRRWLWRSTLWRDRFSLGLAKLSDS